MLIADPIRLANQRTESHAICIDSLRNRISEHLEIIRGYYEQKILQERDSVSVIIGTTPAFQGYLLFIWIKGELLV